MRRLETKDFIIKAIDEITYLTEMWKHSVNIVFNIEIDEDEGNEEVYMNKLTQVIEENLSEIQERLEWIEANQDKLIECLLSEGNVLTTVRNYMGNHHKQEYIQMENGVRLKLPISLEDFLAYVLHCDEIGFGISATDDEVKMEISMFFTARENLLGGHMWEIVVSGNNEIRSLGCCQ